MIGKLIVYEGIDGCGKDTQIGLLNEYLTNQGYNVEVLANVSDSPIGKSIREVLSKPDLYISSIQMACLFLSELFIVDKQIKKLLEEGKTVIMSRWYYSTLAYAGKELSNYLIIKDIASKLINKPNYLVYLDINPEEAIRRISKRDDETDKKIEVYENIDKLVKIHDKYDVVLDMIRFEVKDTNVLRINANNTIEEVFNDIKDELNNRE